MSAAAENSSASAVLIRFQIGRQPGRIDPVRGRVVVAVEGMERAGFEYEAFKTERSAILAANPQLREADVTFVPVSTQHGDMILRRGDHIDWYDGPTLAEALGL